MNKNNFINKTFKFSNNNGCGLVFNYEHTIEKINDGCVFQRLTGNGGLVDEDFMTYQFTATHIQNGEVHPYGCNGEIREYKDGTIKVVFLNGWDNVVEFNNK